MYSIVPVPVCEEHAYTALCSALSHPGGAPFKATHELFISAPATAKQYTHACLVHCTVLLLALTPITKFVCTHGGAEQELQSIYCRRAAHTQHTRQSGSHRIGSDRIHCQRTTQELYKSREAARLWNYYSRTEDLHKRTQYEYVRI